jgi:hypothetical protein
VNFEGHFETKLVREVKFYRNHFSKLQRWLSFYKIFLCKFFQVVKIFFASKFAGFSIEII